MTSLRPSPSRRAATLGAAAVLFALAPAGLADASRHKGPKPKPAPRGGAGQLSIAPSPRVVVFGRSAEISGQLTGVPSAVGTALVIDQSPYPFRSFTRLATGGAGGGGSYAFPVTPGSNTRYRVTAQTSPPTTSAEEDVLVKKRVSIRVRGARVSGLVSPVHTGDPVVLQRRTSRGYRTVATGRLAAAGSTSSRYRFTVRRSGVYRARVAADADHLTGTSAARRVR